MLANETGRFENPEPQIAAAVAEAKSGEWSDRTFVKT